MELFEQMRRDAQIEAAIHSRDLAHKGNEKRQAHYVQRTIAKAVIIVRRDSRTFGR